MGVRKTESRIPAGLQAADLGEAVLSGDGRSALVSFIKQPLVVNRENEYVVFVTDATLAASAQTYEWAFTENGNAPIVQTTDNGHISYTPSFLGSLSLSVRILDGANAEKEKLILEQVIFVLNPQLEAAISGSLDNPGPGIGNLTVARELINDHNAYYQAVTLQTPEAGDAFKLFVFDLVSDGVLQRPAADRRQYLEDLAAALNKDSATFTSLAIAGMGVTGIRLGLLAMTLPGMLDWTEIPEAASQNAIGDEQVREKLGALDEDKRVDLFNLVRFPKSNITQCARIVETLRNKYFGGASFDDVLTGMSGTRSARIVNHFRKGPLTKS